MENFEVVREDRKDVSILRLKGFLDAHTAPQFEQAAVQNNRKYVKSELYKQCRTGCFYGFH